MTYKLNDGCGDSINVPQLVFSKLKDVEDDWLRVALFVIASKTFEPSVIARELRLKGPDKAREALLFWKGAGLLCPDNDKVDICEDADIKPISLTTAEVASAAMTDPNIKSLLQECQTILGSIISQTDANELVALYLCCNMPIDMILMGVSHYAALGKRSGKYIARALQSWQQQGIDSGEACEKYLMLLEQRTVREAEVAPLFGLESPKFTKMDSVLIAEWFEGFGYDCSMIAEAVAYANDKKTVKYVNGILRTWYSKGFKTVKDVQAESTMTMKNIQPSSLAGESKVLDNIAGKIPVYKKKGD